MPSLWSMCVYERARIDEREGTYEQRDHHYEQTGVQMYTFICPNGHVTRSSAKDPIGGCGETACDEGAYRLVTGEQARDAGADPSDCTRFVQHDGVDHCLHLRTGLAYPYRQLRVASHAHLTMMLRSS